jgi:hypothetical protein
MHRRTIVCDAYLRDDGLWEVEARLRDTKPFEYEHFSRGHLEADSAVHDMMLRLTADDDVVVREIDGEMAMTPFLGCQDVLPRMRELIGLRLVAGWRKELKRRIGRRDSCTHLIDLIAPAATTLYQAIGMGKNPAGHHILRELAEASAPPYFLGDCYSWREDGENARRYLPRFATPDPGEP